MTNCEKFLKGLIDMGPIDSEVVYKKMSFVGFDRASTDQARLSLGVKSVKRMNNDVWYLGKKPLGVDG